MPITAPTPPTPPTPPQKLESKTNWAVELHPPVPRFSFGKRKSAPAEEVEEESYDEEFDEESEEEYIEEESEPEEVVEEVEEPNPLQIARDRVQTYHRSEDGKSESTSTQSREPLQTNNRIPGEVRPEEITREAADARGKLIVEQFRKLEEMRDQKESQQSQSQRQSIDIPHINPSEHKSSLGTIIFTITAIVVLAVVAFFTLRKSQLQKRRAEIESKKDLQTPEQTSESKSEPTLESNSEPDPIPKPQMIPATKIRTAYSTPREDTKPIQKSQPIPTAKIKSVDRNPAEPKIKGNFEIRV